MKRSRRAVGNGRIVYPHGERTTPEYNSWRGMIQRCTNPNDPRYDLYGGRGIRVHPGWVASYFNFLKDMGRKPSPYHTLDRIDSCRGYEPGNVRWATPEEQARNTRRKRLITVDGITKNLSEWSEQGGVNQGTITRRLKAGWETKKAVFTPPTINHRYLTINGITKTLTEWSDEFQMDYTTIIKRIKRGWSVKKAVTTPAAKIQETTKLPKFTIEVDIVSLKRLLKGRITSFRFTDSSGVEWKVFIRTNDNLGLARRL